MDHLTACATLAQPLTLPCGLRLPNRLVKCPMQETLAKSPYYEPPVEEFKNLYGQWSAANYGLIITGTTIPLCAIQEKVSYNNESHRSSADRYQM